jgi:hypothetical protein
VKEVLTKSRAGTVLLSLICVMSFKASSAFAFGIPPHDIFPDIAPDAVKFSHQERDYSQLRDIIGSWASNGWLRNRLEKRLGPGRRIWSDHWIVDLEPGMSELKRRFLERLISDGNTREWFEAFSGRKQNVALEIPAALEIPNAPTVPLPAPLLLLGSGLLFLGMAAGRGGKD